MKPLQLKKHITPGVCAVAYCRNKCKSKMCSTCRSRKSRLADPVRYAFNNLRNRAKQRSLIFTITLEQFREWCSKVQYIGFKGRSSSSYTIDRRYNDLGYHIDNIQVLTKQQNNKTSLNISHTIIAQSQLMLVLIQRTL
jgi:hypothetical protein